MYKIRIVGNSKDKIRVLDFLHKEGFLHLTQGENGLSQDSPLDRVNKISEYLLDLRWISDSLETYSTKKPKKLMSLKRDFDQICKDADDLVQEVRKRLRKALQDLNRLSNENNELKGKLDAMERVPFSIYEKGEMTSLILVNSENDIGPLDNATIIREENYHMVQVLQEHKDEVMEKIKSMDLDMIHIPETIDKKDASKKIRANEKEIAKIKRELKILSDRYYPRASFLMEELSIMHDRYCINSSINVTETSFTLEGYVGKKDFSRIRKLGNIVKVHISGKPVDEGPTKLRNLPYVKRFEFITKMFGLPEYKKIDPTVYISLFLPFFFGFMFSDIGYGVMILLISASLYAFSNVKMKVMKDSAFVLLVCGISTIIFGLLFGSFFGNLIKMQPILFDPFTNAKYILVASLALGLIHLNLGIILSIIENVRSRDIRSLFVDNIPFITLQAGVLCFFIGMAPLGYVYLLITLVLLFIKSKVMGIMEITGFVGNWFSYARLLALSLATGGIALGVNIMADQLMNVALIGPILFVLLLLVGHLFNFAMNILGSSIHSVRLHYIEFFSQFYSGAGEPFEAYTAKRTKETL